MGTVTAALAVLGALGLAGCGGSGSPEGTASAPASTEGTASAPGSAEAYSPGPAPVKPVGDALDGSWGGDLAVLNISGHRVELLGGPKPCGGTVAVEEQEPPVIRLDCDNPDEERTVGKVWGLTEKSMSVEWEGLGGEIFTRTG
ncbi:hypothetical protein [Streptomyces sp. SID8352]|uniref:hypothetical protein n=1 Tax=Streptomyces sp. SID8352 TaxID=2690338 RepID=UPI0013681243|nr:hypothetical protein [Streptomyces sp. SID8352]MYU22449.1 hypothetical protein [Streptomyces sp. SID8352]